ncbi:hypothetical protein BDR26DRAFT_896034 [Obelidium mucronatum]|nr:hypothetical protein BDR26DRAFT_896034 [Obelidium mucronatum]
MAYAVVATNTTTNTTNPLDGEFLTTEWEGITVIISIAISYSGAMYTILLNEVRGRWDLPTNLMPQPKIKNDSTSCFYSFRYEPPHSNTYSLVLLIMSALSTSIRAIFFMHFVGMTAVTLHIGSTHEKVPVYFDYGWTILSAVICGLTILWAFHFAVTGRILERNHQQTNKESRSSRREKSGANYGAAETCRKKGRTCGEKISRGITLALKAAQSWVASVEPAK